MGSIHQNIKQAWKSEPRTGIWVTGRSPEGSNLCIRCKGKYTVKCHVPYYLFCNYRMCNIFIMRKKVKKENLPAFWPQATEHDVPNAPSCGNAYYYPSQGVRGQATPTPNILVTLNLWIQLKSCTLESEKPWGWQGEKRWARTRVSGTGNFPAVLGKLVVETALSKWWVRGDLGSFDDQQALWGKRGKDCHRVHLCGKPRRSTRYHSCIVFHVANFRAFGRKQLLYEFRLWGHTMLGLNPGPAPLWLCSLSKALICKWR